jgi:3',5'-nucleoside bisphosphate phosphatase
MTMNWADLHAHTTASDGTFTPRELVVLAKKNGLAAVAVTDHDTTGGLQEALQAGRELGVEVVPGIEISTEFEGREVHVLGYFYDPENDALQELTQRMRDDRLTRMDRMIDKLNAAGLDITRDEVLEESKGGAIGRPHIARVLMNKGYVANIPEAFDKYLGSGKIGYVERLKLTPEHAVEVILGAGGVPVVAHPGLFDKDYLFDTLVPLGLVGLEASHPDHPEEKRTHYKALAQHHGLIATGGSDFHGGGAEHRGDLGTVRVPLDTVEQLKAKSAYLNS